MSDATIVGNVEVTQADRDLESWFTRRMGGAYKGHIAPMLARHRLAASPPPPAPLPVQALVEALEGVLTYSGARGVYSSIMYTEAVEKAEAALAKFKASAGEVG